VYVLFKLPEDRRPEQWLEFMAKEISKTNDRVTMEVSGYSINQTKQSITHKGLYAEEYYITYYPNSNILEAALGSD